MPSCASKKKRRIRSLWHGYRLRRRPNGHRRAYCLRMYQARLVARRWRPPRHRHADSPRVFFFLMIRRPPRSTRFPYTTLFRSHDVEYPQGDPPAPGSLAASQRFQIVVRSEEHTSELQSRRDLVCRLLLEKKKTRKISSFVLKKKKKKQQKK